MGLKQGTIGRSARASSAPQSGHLARRVSCAAFVVALLVAMASPSTASAVIFCNATYLGDGYCNQGHYHGINTINGNVDWANGPKTRFCVMRATGGYAGAPDYGEYCTGESGYISQNFWGNAGYAQTHNRHSYQMGAYGTAYFAW
jgi:hypothetical protein